MESTTHDGNVGAAEGSSTTVTVDSAPPQHVPVLRLRLKKPKSNKRVEWSSETVDNEHMNKKKSKCCCIFEKPRTNIDESSDEEDDTQCEHCHGHVELRIKSKPSTSTNLE